MNTLYYGDNLKILRDYIKDESVDLTNPTAVLLGKAIVDYYLT